MKGQMKFVTLDYFINKSIYAMSHVILGVVYTMDCKVIPMPCKMCNWMLNSSWEHLSLNQKFVFVRVTIWSSRLYTH
jgi:hypothetical protein